MRLNAHSEFPQQLFIEISELFASIAHIDQLAPTREISAEILDNFLNEDVLSSGGKADGLAFPNP